MSFRRLIVRDAHDAVNSLGFVQVRCMVILLRWYV